MNVIRLFLFLPTIREYIYIYIHISIYGSDNNNIRRRLWRFAILYCPLRPSFPVSLSFPFIAGGGGRAENLAGQREFGFVRIETGLRTKIKI